MIVLNPRLQRVVFIWNLRNCSYLLCQKEGKADGSAESGVDAPRFVEETPKMMMKPLGRPILKKREDGENLNK